MDKETIKRILSGDKDEFDQLMNKYYKELFRFILRQTNDVETTKNLSQEIWMRIYHKLRTYNANKSSFRTWMYHLSSNYIRNYFRHRKTLVTLVPYDVELSSKEDILAEVTKQEEVDYIITQMKNTLNHRNFEMLMLHFFSALSNQEIAEAFSVSEKTVRNTLSMSIQKIRMKVGERNE